MRYWLMILVLVVGCTGEKGGTKSKETAPEKKAEVDKQPKSKPEPKAEPKPEPTPTPTPKPAQKDKDQQEALKRAKKDLAKDLKMTPSLTKADQDEILKQYCDLYLKIIKAEKLIDSLIVKYKVPKGKAQRVRKRLLDDVAHGAPTPSHDEIITALIEYEPESNTAKEEPLREELSERDRRNLQADKNLSKAWAIRDLNKDLQVNRARGRELTKAVRKQILEEYERQFFLKLRASRRTVKLGVKHKIPEKKMRAVSDFYMKTLKHTDTMPTDDEILARLNGTVPTPIIKNPRLTETEPQMADRLAKARLAQLMKPLLKSGNKDQIDDATMKQAKKLAQREGAFSARMYFYILEKSKDRALTEGLFNREFRTVARTFAGMKRMTVEEMIDRCDKRVYMAIFMEKERRK